MKPPRGSLCLLGGLSLPFSEAYLHKQHGELESKSKPLRSPIPLKLEKNWKGDYEYG